MSHLIVSASSRRRLVAGALATTLLAPAPSLAFFQNTKLEGTIGTDIGGVWLSTHQVMPEFRITFPKPATERTLPFTVGPIPADLEPVTGKPAVGVSITECTGTFCAENGLLVGDIIVKVGPAEVANVAEYEKTLEALAPTVMLSVRRPALRLTTARLIKIRYSKEGKETEEGSVEQEQLDVKVLDSRIPFYEGLEATRKTHTFFEPSPADLENLSKNWAQLPQNEPLQLVSGQHRFVARDSFDEALASDRSLKNAKYAIVMDMAGNPLRSGAGGKLIDIYGIETVSGDTMEGNYVTVTIASAPFPINVEFKGRFRMKRVAPWSDEDDKIREKLQSQKKPPEDLKKFKTLPDVPPPTPDPAGKK